MSKLSEQKPVAKTSKYPIKLWLILWLTLFLLSTLSVFAQWLKNKYQVSVYDLFFPLIICLINGLVVSRIFLRRFAKNRFAGIIAAFFLVLILGTGFQSRLNSVATLIKAFYPFNLQVGYINIIICLIFVVLSIILAFLIFKLINGISNSHNWNSAALSNVVIVIITATFLAQSYSVVRVLIAEWPQYFYKPPTISGLKQPSSGFKPDIYYINLDRYSSQSVLSSQFNFDNANFVNYLNANGFNVNGSANSNYPYTTMSIASTLNLNYDSQLTSEFSGASTQTVDGFHNAIKNSSVIAALKSIGYKYNLVGNWYDTSNASPLADQTFQPEGQLTVLGHQVTLSDFVKNGYLDSDLAPFANFGLQIGSFKLFSYGTVSETNQILYQLDTLNDLAAEKAGGRFIFAHILVPHDPYYFNADGSLNVSSGSENTSEPIKTKYINQVKFINTQMQSLVDRINKNSDGKAIIILQSDEGPYPVQLNQELVDNDQIGDELSGGDMRKWSAADLKMKFGVLAAYHVPQATAADLAAGADPLNIFRVVFNSYFGTKFSYLPECYYAYPNGRDKPYVFANINQVLVDESDSCPSNGVFK